MEHSSNLEEQMETIKSNMDLMKNPAKNNLKNLNEITTQFESATAALLNPIKKLKISYNMRINSFKGKYENILASVKHKISALEKNKKAKEIKNFNSVFVDETVQQSAEISREHRKLMNLLEECLMSITALNELFDTEEYNKLDELTKSLSQVKKKSKLPMLELNEVNNGEYHSNDEDKAERTNGKLNGNNKSKLNGHIKAKSKSNGEEVEVIELEELSENENNKTMQSSKILNKKQNRNNKVSSSSTNKNMKKTNINTNQTSALNNKINNINENNSEININDNENLQEDSKMRKLTDEEVLDKMKEQFPDDKGLTKTFITRKLKKRISIYRKLDFNDEDTFKGVENTIPKKSGPNSYLKITVEICNRDDFSLESPLMFFMKDLFINYFIIFKEKEKKMKIVIAGHINRDIISFLKKVSSEEFRNKYSAQTMKIKVYAFYEELINEFYNRENIIAKIINEEEIKEFVDQFNMLTKMRKAYEEIKQIKIEKN